MRALLDVNVLIALLDAERDCHESARECREWFKVNRWFGWASCPLTENGVVRFMTLPSYRKPLQRKAEDVIGALRLTRESSDHRFWADDLSRSDPNVFTANRIRGSKQITDIYLLALAVKHNGWLATFDTRISLDAVVGATPAHLAVIESS